MREKSSRRRIPSWKVRERAETESDSQTDLEQEGEVKSSWKEKKAKKLRIKRIRGTSRWKIVEAGKIETEGMKKRKPTMRLTRSGRRMPSRKVLANVDTESEWEPEEEVKRSQNRKTKMKGKRRAEEKEKGAQKLRRKEEGTWGEQTIVLVSEQDHSQEKLKSVPLPQPPKPRPVKERVPLKMMLWENTQLSNPIDSKECCDSVTEKEIEFMEMALATPILMQHLKEEEYHDYEPDSF